MFQQSLSLSHLRCQAYRPRAPFVRFADIFPDNGEIFPRQRGPRALLRLCNI